MVRKAVNEPLSEAGKILRQKRNELGLTQKEIAEKVGLSGKTYGAYETGRNTLTPKAANKLSILFDGDEKEVIEWLLNLNKDSSKDQEQIKTQKDNLRSHTKATLAKEENNKVVVPTNHNIIKSETCSANKLIKQDADIPYYIITFEEFIDTIRVIKSDLDTALKIIKQNQLLYLESYEVVIAKNNLYLCLFYQQENNLVLRTCTEILGRPSLTIPPSNGENSGNHYPGARMKIWFNASCSREDKINTIIQLRPEFLLPHFAFTLI